MSENCVNSYVFSIWIPLGVSPSTNSLPFPTIPKFDDAATAIRESK